MSRKTIANALRKLRIQSGLTANQVGELLGKSGKTVNAWENNRGQPDAEALMMLCDIYKVQNILEEFRDIPEKKQILPSKESANFKDRLQEAMKLRNVTAAELSRKAELSRAQLSQYVNGTYEAKQLALHKLAVALNVSEIWLMGYDVSVEEQIINASDFSEKEKSLILSYRAHPEMQDAIQKLLDINNTN